MPSTRQPSVGTLHTLALLSLLSATTVHTQRTIALPPLRREARVDRRAGLSYSGCYSSSTGLTDQGAATYQTSSYCSKICVPQNQAVLGLSGGSDCWCGALLPPADTKVDDSNCNTPCQGFGADNCGGTNFWSVYLTGTSGSVANAGDSSSSSSSSAAATTTTAVVVAAAPPPPSTTSTSTSNTVTEAPSVVTSVAPGTTVVVTAPAADAGQSSTSSPTPSPSGGGHSNKAGVAAGAVVGTVLGLAGIAALVFWFKQKRRKEANEAYQRSNQVSEFMQGGREAKPPASAYSNMSDNRLDPEAGARRNSVGSIADNQDYSRKILRVANPDDS